jgi:hypothetical protein
VNVDLFTLAHSYSGKTHLHSGLSLFPLLGTRLIVVVVSTRAPIYNCGAVIPTADGRKQGRTRRHDVNTQCMHMFYGERDNGMHVLFEPTRGLVARGNLAHVLQEFTHA